jgi:hypothetical protein
MTWHRGCRPSLHLFYEQSLRRDLQEKGALPVGRPPRAELSCSARGWRLSPLDGLTSASRHMVSGDFGIAPVGSKTPEPRRFQRSIKCRGSLLCLPNNVRARRCHVASKTCRLSPFISWLGPQAAVSARPAADGHGLPVGEFVNPLAAGLTQEFDFDAEPFECVRVLLVRSQQHGEGPTHGSV